MNWRSAGGCRPAAFVRLRGFTMVELMVAMGILGLLLVPVWQIFSSGTRTTVQGMMKGETTNEAQRILHQVRLDLKQACRVASKTIDCSFLTQGGGFVKCTGTPPEVKYTFYTFPTHGTADEAIDNPANPNVRKTVMISEVTLSVEKLADPNKPLRRLIRE